MVMYGDAEDIGGADCWQRLVTLLTSKGKIWVEKVEGYDCWQRLVTLLTSKGKIWVEKVEG
ncbi:hypothetical protein Acr_13g0006710 [Actinidia rufa]|uniref:Uncharacterized protein n=1 Tax=Actinidia rufa TaxID=165716 RepID=A0A7J0FKS0_9ERIC|nr:hypothetical protein Acr_13g0006710 [Actinidia rufa]